MYILSPLLLLITSANGLSIENSILCTETCKKCVYNGILSDLVCAQCPKHPSYWPCYVKDHCRCDDNREALNCPYAASRTPDRTNSDCVQWCDAVVDHGVTSVEKFLKECSIEFVESRETDKFADLKQAPCYDKYIHGHKDSSQSINGDFEVGVLAEGVITSPHQCQEACQLVDGCERFIWRWRDDKVEKRGTCILKSKAIIEHAAMIVVDPKHPGSIDAKLCDKLAVEKCAQKDKCVGCPQPRCIWESEFHISGPQFCDNRSLCPAVLPGAKDPLSPSKNNAQNSSGKKETAGGSFLPPQGVGKPQKVPGGQNVGETGEKPHLQQPHGKGQGKEIPSKAAVNCDCTTNGGSNSGDCQHCKNNVHVVVKVDN